MNYFYKLNYKMIYTKDNPKLVNSIFDLKPEEKFTGVVRNSSNHIFHYLDGKRHREDGPAIEWFNGNKYWCLYGELHREDGPAIECSDGDKEWYLNGEIYGYNDDFTNESWIRFVRLQLLK